MRNQSLTFDVLRLMSPISRLLCGFICLLLCVACVPPLPRIVKIGLVAPFEGRYRYVGYDAIYAARLAVQELNAAGGVGGRQLELVAYDDRGDPELARTAARNLVTDPDVVAVIGHYRQASTEVAAPLYVEAGLPLVLVGARVASTPGVWQLTSPDAVAVNGGPELAVDALDILTPYPLPQDVPDVAAWTEAYLSMDLYAPQPGPYALPTYEAVYVLAAALAGGVPTRAGVAGALPDVTREGLLGRIAWDSAGYWRAAPLYRYRWEAGAPVLVSGE